MIGRLRVKNNLNHLYKKVAGKVLSAARCGLINNKEDALKNEDASFGGVRGDFLYD